MSTLNCKNIDLIRATVAETVNVLMSDPDFGLQLRPSFRKEIVERMKSLKKNKLVPFSKIKNRFVNV